MQHRDHFLTLLLALWSIVQVALAGPVSSRELGFHIPPVGQAFWYVPVSDQ
jgi:hypothetical protein